MTDVLTPPPPLTEEDAAFDPSRRSAVKVLWDLALIHGPASRADLHRHRPVISWNYREYVRWHPEAKGDHSDAILRTADRWAFDRAIDRSLERGWLVEQDGLLSVGTLPPEHVPLSTKSLDTVRHELLDMESKEAMAVLTAKTNKSRMKPTREGRALLARSLRERGQLEPIVVWKPHPTVWKDEIIVNGATRSEILAEMGVEPVKRYLPPETTAAEVLLMRIEFEVAATSKDVSRAGRDAYIEQLAAEGVSQKDISKAVGLSLARVGQLLSATKADFSRRQGGPDSTAVARFVALRDAGFPLRDIADDTQWSKDTVAKYLAIYDADLPKENPLPGEGTAASTFLQTLIELGRATQREAYEAAGLEQAQVSGQMNDFVKKGLVEIVDKVGTSNVYAPTTQALALTHKIGPRPKPKAQPAAKPKAKPPAEVISIVPQGPGLDEYVDDLFESIVADGYSVNDVIAGLRKRLARHGLRQV